MSGIGTVLQMIWMILIILAVLLYMFTKDLVWKTAYLILIVDIPVLLYFFPEGFVPVAECSMEERIFAAMISLFMLSCIFWYHIHTQLKSEEGQNEVPFEAVLWPLFLLPETIGLCYVFYTVTESSILICLILFGAVLAAFLWQHIVTFIAAVNRRKKKDYLTEHRNAGISYKMLSVIVLLNIAMVCCFVITGRNSLLCGLCLMYIELFFFIYRSGPLLKMKSQVLHGISLWIFTLLVFGIITGSNFYVEINRYL